MKRMIFVLTMMLACVTMAQEPEPFNPPVQINKNVRIFYGVADSQTVDVYIDNNKVEEAVATWCKQGYIKLTNWNGRDDLYIPMSNVASIQHRKNGDDLPFLRHLRNPFK